MASRGKHVQLDHMFVADFETCDSYTAVSSIPPQKVWLAGWRNLATGQTQTYNSLDGFMTSILSRGDNQNTEYAFHNLKFDGSFIVPWLLRNDFTVTQEKPQSGQFSVLIDNMNNWYTITIQVTKRRRVFIWDSLKLFPTALEYLPEIYGTPTQKLRESQEFYTRIREEQHIPDQEELSYFQNDLDVLFETLNAHIRFYGLQFKKTQASQAYKNFEDHFPWWKKRFPALSVDLDSEMRKAYWGGVSYANQDHAGNDMEDIDVYDINSSYPAQLAYQKMPYGPCQYTWKDKHPNMALFWVAKASVRFKLKPGKVPCIMKKGVVENRPITLDSWLTSSDGTVKLVFSCIDYRTFQDSYDFEVLSWDWSHHFAWKVQKEIQAFILKNNEEKVRYKDLAQTEEDLLLKNEYLARAQRAKINNNAFYGKFGEEIIKKGKTPYLVEATDDVHYVLDREEIQKEGKRKYLPLAIATTAYGRRQLVYTANVLGDHFYYCDTDSVHHGAEGRPLLEAAAERGLFEIHRTKLGAWKYEGHFDRGRYLRAKCYYEEAYGKDPEVTLAGLPADAHSGSRSKKRSCITWENFRMGLTIPGGNGRLRSVRTPTGNKLVPADFTITQHVKFTY
ncbi:MAG: hypothetical protein EOM07_05160 [Clostridia bacterium]|nr:hypothetical protein [Clostridia bacterium]